ncbi:DEAD/DEAH box helicase [Curvibacter sp. APW13]|uniref:DEAD/DEAH box helicase n=1 Tax=Curvibacter sp. APW13 TaxID=3077236 RepID=UPI0028DE4E6F|nr:DEAD/DEAH box helicase [Curvibacter sp. APW13]MDT8989379.1 DEAD/DEAH box helicase [Curvibacter sp. APW13]
MTDTMQVAGDFAPAEISLDNNAAVVDTLVQDDTPNGFVELGLAPQLVQAVKDLGYVQPTSVQTKAIPLALPTDDEEHHGYNDLMVSSQTGSGKTAAFLLPVLHTLIEQQAQAEAQERADYERAVAEAAAKGDAAPKRPKRKDPTNPRNFKAAVPGALVLCPTRELAQQVAHDAIDLVKHCRGLRIANIVGGMPYQLQIAKLQNANLVVATPGRLLDLQRSMQIKLDQVQFLVVDEADRMLDLGFSDDLAEINQLTSQRRQTMMFSATFAPRIQQLAMRVMHDGGTRVRKVQIDTPQEKHANIKQSLFWADNAQHKRKLLDHWLRDSSIDQAIVFASTQIECDGLAADLQQDGFSAVALHGALSQGMRNRRLMALRNGQVKILVATDVAARGIDVPTITHVFNFGLPMKAEDYTHRIGRTGRAGRDGLAVTFAEFRDRRKIMDIEQYTHQPLKAETIPGMEPQQRFPDTRAGLGGRGGRRDDRAPRGGGRRFDGPREGGFTNGPREGGFSYERKGGFNDRFAGQGFSARRDNGDRPHGRGGFGNGPREGGFANGPREGGFGGGRRVDGPREGGFGGGRDFHAPREGGRDFGGQREGGFGGNRGGFDAPRGDFKPAFARPAGFGKAAGNGGKPFTPRDGKKRPARNFD